MSKCKHPSLRVAQIAIAERCPGCNCYVTSSGKSFATISAALAARKKTG